MGMTQSYVSFGGFDEEKSLRTLDAAHEMGIRFWDTADMYGPESNEVLIGKWFQKTGKRKDIFLATKFANTYEPGGKLTGRVRGDREYVKWACGKSLERLGVDTIDLYYQHRVDSRTPIEVTVEAMVELKNEGKIRYLGLSECSAASLRRACKIHPISAAQMEYSPFALEIESEQTEFLRTARELGVQVVAYSPLGRGFLTGTISSRDDLDEKDSRFHHPRFSEKHFGENMKLVQALSSIATRKGITPGQLSLAFVLAQGPDFIPIPGTKRVKYLQENAKAVEIKLTDEELMEIRTEIGKIGGMQGERYPARLMDACFGDSPELSKA
jgi:aryl-alcohol dehydrogenase-like predicted oxidoreductase